MGVTYLWRRPRHDYGFRRGRVIAQGPAGPLPPVPTLGWAFDFSAASYGALVALLEDI